MESVKGFWEEFFVFRFFYVSSSTFYWFLIFVVACEIPNSSVLCFWVKGRRLDIISKKRDLIFNFARPSIKMASSLSYLDI